MNYCEQLLKAINNYDYENIRNYLKKAEVVVIDIEHNLVYIEIRTKTLTCSIDYVKMRDCLDIIENRNRLEKLKKLQ
jgi:primase-polymerase (primpol)-like protein